MPTICMFRGIKIFINWRDYMPPHFHAVYGGDEVLVSIQEIEVIEGSYPRGLRGGHSFKAAENAFGLGGAAPG